MATAAEARVARANAVTRRRNDEALCALDFLTWGDTRGAHEKRCIRPAGLVCSREYDPGPVPEDEKMYEGTALGSLWGLNGVDEDPFAWQLAGWNIRREEIA
jgi:hypothetical protein